MYSQRPSSQSSVFIFERFSMVSQRWPCLWKKMYLSPKRCAVSVSLKSLGLSKDPKDAQRRPSCFPDVLYYETFSGMFIMTFYLVCTRRSWAEFLNWIQLFGSTSKVGMRTSLTSIHMVVAVVRVGIRPYTVYSSASNQFPQGNFQSVFSGLVLLHCSCSLCCHLSRFLFRETPLRAALYLKLNCSEFSQRWWFFVVFIHGALRFQVHIHKSLPTLNPDLWTAA